MSGKMANFFGRIFLVSISSWCNSMNFLFILIMKKPGPAPKIAQALADIQAAGPRHGVVSKVARAHGIPVRTLNNAWNKLCNARAAGALENNVRLANRVTRVVEPRGATSHRLLTDEEEALVVKRLRAQHPHGFTDKIVLQTCIDATRNLRDRPRRWSRTFLAGFKQRSGIRRAKFRPRTRKLEDPNETFEQDVRAAIQYIDEVEQLVESIPLHLIINVDETPSYVRNAPSTALHFVDTPGPWAWTRASERDKVTVIAACTGEGAMLKSAIVAKGLTSKCETQFID
jgi:hypothetical protein